jgi:hypothetical protein
MPAMQTQPPCHAAKLPQKELLEKRKISGRRKIDSAISVLSAGDFFIRRKVLTLSPGINLLHGSDKGSCKRRNIRFVERSRTTPPQQQPKTCILNPKANSLVSVSFKLKLNLLNQNTKPNQKTESFSIFAPSYLKQWQDEAERGKPLVSR